MNVPSKLQKWLYLELVERELISQTESQLGMLQHMLKAQVLQLVLSSVNLLVTVLKAALDDECTRVPSLACTGVIGASITTLGLDIWNIAVSGDDLLDERGKTNVDKIGDDADGFGLSRIESLLDVSGHVLLQHSLDLTSFLGILLEDFGRA